MKQPINAEMKQIQWSGVTFIQCDLYSDLSEIVLWSMRKITNKKRWANSPEVQAFLAEVEEHVDDKILVLKQAKPEIGGFHISSELVSLIGDKYVQADWFKNGVKSKWALGQMVELLYATALSNLSQNWIPPYEAIDKTASRSQIQEIHNQISSGGIAEDEESLLTEEDQDMMKSIEDAANEYRKNIRPVRNVRAEQQKALEKEREIEQNKSTPGHMVPRGTVQIWPKRPQMEEE